MLNRNPLANRFGPPTNGPISLNREALLNIGGSAWWMALPGGGGGRYPDLYGVNHGALTGFTPGFGFGPTQRKGGFAEVKYDGANDYTLVNQAPILNVSTTLTISLWFSVALGPNANNKAILSKTNTPDASGAVNYYIGIKATTGTLFFYRFGGTTDNIDSLVVPPTAVWTHTGITISPPPGGGSLILKQYVNGLPVMTTTLSLGSMPADTSNVALGRYNGASVAQWFPGSIDDVWLSTTRVYSDADMLARYRDALAGHPATLVRGFAQAPAYIVIPPVAVTRRTPSPGRIGSRSVA